MEQPREKAIETQHSEHSRRPAAQAIQLPAKWQRVYRFAHFIQSRFVGDGVAIVVADRARATAKTWAVAVCAVPEFGGRRR